jgi:hypothetical protein
VSQGLTPEHRLQRRADRIYQGLDQRDDGLVYKPKWMRWRTFNRRMDLANELSARADEYCNERVFRLFGKYLTT